MCLDYLQEDKSEEKTNPIANGSIGEKTEQTPTNENGKAFFKQQYFYFVLAVLHLLFQASFQIGFSFKAFSWWLLEWVVKVHFVVFNSDDNLSVYYLKDEQNVPEENSFSSNSSLATPGYMKKVEFNLDLDLLGGESDFNDSIDAEATDTAQNENNNNVSNAGKYNQKKSLTNMPVEWFLAYFMLKKVTKIRSMHG